MLIDKLTPRRRGGSKQPLSFLEEGKVRKQSLAYLLGRKSLAPKASFPFSANNQSYSATTYCCGEVGSLVSDPWFSVTKVTAIIPT